MAVWKQLDEGWSISWEVRRAYEGIFVVVRVFVGLQLGTYRIFSKLEGGVVEETRKASE
jgi:hypothetical protein